MSSIFFDSSSTRHGYYVCRCLTLFQDRFYTFRGEYQLATNHNGFVEHSLSPETVDIDEEFSRW